MKSQKHRFLRYLFKLTLALLLIIAGHLATQSKPPDVLGTTTPGFYRVVQVEDGDTITIDMDGQKERIRMIGVDTPETKDPRKPVQCFGRAASDFTKRLLGDQPVRLEADAQSDNRDRYNRLLRHVYLPDGQLVQAELIREGYGFAYTNFPFTKADEFRELQREARQNNRGLWGNCQPSPNQYGGHTSNPE